MFSTSTKLKLTLKLHSRATLTSTVSSSCTTPSCYCYSSLVAPPTSPSSLLLRLRSDPTLAELRQLHSVLLVHGHHRHAVLTSQLVHVYVKLGTLQDALHLFDGMPERNSFAWNAIIKGFVDAGRFLEALELYWAMVVDGSVAADRFTYPPVIRACAALGAIDQGRRIQEIVEADVACGHARSNVFVQCALVDMFAKCGSLDEARSVFERMHERDLATWSAMIGGTVRQGDGLEAMCLFKQMRLEGFGVDSVILATVIPVCGRIGELWNGMTLHGCAVRCGASDDLCVSNALVDMYCKCRHVEIGRHLFQSIKFKDVVSWSSLISGYSQNGMHCENLSLFSQMVASGLRPNSVTLASILPSLSDLKLSDRGKEVHCFAIRHALERSEFIVSAFIDFYSRKGSMRHAEIVFELMIGRDLVIWNSMIAGYSANGDADSAFHALRTVQKLGFRLDHVTILSVLPVCNHMSMLSWGKQLHCYVVRHNHSSVISVSNSLIDMYCKCGSLELAKVIFELMMERDVVTYNTIIAAFGMHGHADQALVFFDHMKQEGIDPDRLTFVAVLSSCSHAGVVDRGLYFYNSMVQDYDITPEKEHYSCIVDLYSRSGKLNDAWNFISNMLVEPEIDVLGCLLGACRVHKRMDIAELVGKQIFEHRPADPGYYVLLSNIYADAGRWSDVMRVRDMIQERGLKKKSGNSFTESVNAPI